MKFTKEARIGLLVAIAILIFFAGFYFLKGANLFSGENEYYVYYSDVQGLQPSSAVLIKGLSVGHVSAINLTEDGKVKVTIAVSKKTNVPQGTVANLMATDLLGTKAISLELGGSKMLVEDETVLPGKVEGGIIDAISVEITPLLQDMRHAVGTLDSVLGSINYVLDSNAQTNLKSSLANLNTTMTNFSELSHRLNAESGHLQGIIRNTNSITSNLASNNERINRVITNAEQVTNQLNNAPIEQTVKSLQETIDQLKAVSYKLNSNEGSLGLLVNDTSLYRNINSSLNSLNFLMSDIEAHPTRYINVSIFGRKK
jgi:phospholipid/cholesterol/gamma-HCH transport system substrate-binding protein